MTLLEVHLLTRDPRQVPRGAVDRGRWFSELTHAWHVFEARGFTQSIVSPRGGGVPLEPRSLKFPNYDKTAKAWRAEPVKLAVLDCNLAPVEINECYRVTRRS